MSNNTDVFEQLKRILDSLCTTFRSVDANPKNISLHISKKDAEWNKLALEVAEDVQSSKPCSPRVHQGQSGMFVINISHDTDSWNKLALAFSERDRKRRDLEGKPAPRSIKRLPAHA